MTVDATADSLHRHSRWTLVSGCVTLLLAIVAFFLPEIDWAPKGRRISLQLCRGKQPTAGGGGSHLTTSLGLAGALMPAFSRVRKLGPTDFVGRCPRKR